MKLTIPTVSLFIATILYVSTLFAVENSPQKSSGGQVSIVFTDTNVFRRSLDSAPIIGEGMEDYTVKIGCMGKSDCIAKIRLIYDLVSIKSRPVKSCKTPIYARVTLSPDSVGYGESDKNEVEIYDIDHTGTCVTYQGNSYKIRKSIFYILNTKPINKWSEEDKG